MAARRLQLAPGGRLAPLALSGHHPVFVAHVVEKVPIPFGDLAPVVLHTVPPRPAALHADTVGAQGRLPRLDSHGAPVQVRQVFDRHHTAPPAMVHEGPPADIRVVAFRRRERLVEVVEFPGFRHVEAERATIDALSDSEQVSVRVVVVPSRRAVLDPTDHLKVRDSGQVGECVSPTYREHVAPQLYGTHQPLIPAALVHHHVVLDEDRILAAAGPEARVVGSRFMDVGRDDLDVPLNPVLTEPLRIGLENRLDRVLAGIGAAVVDDDQFEGRARVLHDGIDDGRRQPTLVVNSQDDAEFHRPSSLVFVAVVVDDRLAGRRPTALAPMRDIVGHVDAPHLAQDREQALVVTMLAVAGIVRTQRRGVGKQVGILAIREPAIDELGGEFSLSHQDCRAVGLSRMGCRNEIGIHRGEDVPLRPHVFRGILPRGAGLHPHRGLEYHDPLVIEFSFVDVDDLVDGIDEPAAAIAVEEMVVVPEFAQGTRDDVGLPEPISCTPLLGQDRLVLFHERGIQRRAIPRPHIVEVAGRDAGTGVSLLGQEEAVIRVVDQDFHCRDRS